MGGKTQITVDICHLFPWIRSFSETKVITANILRYINDTMGYNIEPLAIHSTLNQVAYGRDLALGKKNARHKILDVFATQQMVTVVAYPVGMHQDCTGLLPCFENKKCFVMEYKKIVGLEEVAPVLINSLWQFWTGQETNLELAVMIIWLPLEDSQNRYQE